MVADADEINAEYDDVATALSDSINKAGTKAFAANQPMGGFKLTGLGAGSSNGDSVRYEQLTGLSATYQPLDALLTAIAALTTADDRMLDFTGSDTVAVVTYATVLSNIGGAAASLYAALAGANVFTHASAISMQAASPVLDVYATSGTPSITIRTGSRYDDIRNTSSGLSFRVDSSGSPKELLFASGGDLQLVAAPTSLATNSAGFRGVPQTLISSNYTPVIGNAGGMLRQSTGSPYNITIPPNSDVAFPVGTTLVLEIATGGGTFTILEGSGVTIYRVDGVVGSGTRTVTANSRAALIKIDTNAWDIGGVIAS